MIAGHTSNERSGLKMTYVLSKKNNSFDKKYKIQQEIVVVELNQIRILNSPFYMSF